MTAPLPERTRPARRTPLIPRWVLILGAVVVAAIASYPYYGTNQYIKSL